MKNYVWVILFLLVPNLLSADAYCKAFKSYKLGNTIQARQELDPLAFKGDLRAQNLLGLVNLEEKNNSAAKKWFQSAAVKGDAKAAYNLGVYYYDLGQNSQAEKWMHKAESLNEAKLALGVLYTLKDESKAKAYFYLAAEEGNTFAASHLCAMLMKNRTKSDEKYAGYCQGNDVQASLITGAFYTSPKKYGSIDKAIYYLEDSAQKGNAEAMNLLGKTLLKRNGPMDQDRAMKYFLKAAEQGNIDAKVNAAWLYYTGQRWTRDPKKGIDILNKALKYNHPKAQFYMGLLCMKGMAFSGDTVQKDTAKGLLYIKASAMQNDPEALEYLIENYRNDPKNESYKKQLRSYDRDKEQGKALHFLSDEC
jgi:TPR repeat protein